MGRTESVVAANTQPLAKQSPKSKTLLDDMNLPSAQPLDVLKDTHGSKAEDDDEYDSSTSSSSSSNLWDVLVTLYFPIMFLWMRRSMFGTANLIRSLLLGQCIRLFLNYLTTSTKDEPSWSDSVTPWLQTFVEGKDPNAWPTPPALTLLVFLTILAFIVHPDGLTWFILRKSRDAVMAFFQSSRMCWSVLIQGYGSIATVVALITLFGIGLLLALMLRGLMPRTSSKRGGTAKEKKKKKRKGHHLRRNGGRARQQQLRAAPSPIPENEPDEATAETLAVEGKTEMVDKQTPSLERQEEAPLKVHDSAPLRPRKHSYSTADTDDVSCGSTSVISYASAPTAVSASEQSGKSAKSEDTHDAKGRGRRKQKSRKSKRRSENVQTKFSNPIQSKAPNLEPLRLQGEVFEKPTATSRSKSEKRRAAPRREQAPRGHFAAAAKKPQEDSFFSVTSPLSTPHPYKASNNHTTLTKHTPSSPSMRPIFAQSATNGHDYSATNFASLSPSYQTSESNNTGKMELMEFLSKSGLQRTESARLLNAIPDVDALERLDGVEYRTLGISPEKQAEICWLLDLRRRSRAEQMRNARGASPTSVLRPPPGLSGSSSLSTMEGPLVPSVRPTISSALSSPYNPFVTQDNNPFSIETPQHAPQQLYVPQTTSSVSTLKSSPSKDAAEEESRIEAELQELGGQMVGSVLDF